MIERTGSFLLVLVVAPCVSRYWLCLCTVFCCAVSSTWSWPRCSSPLVCSSSVPISLCGSGRLFLRAAETRFPGRVTDAREHRLPIYRLFVIVTGVVIALVLWLVLERTTLGSMVRAGVDDEEMVRGWDQYCPNSSPRSSRWGFLAALSGVIGGPLWGPILGPTSRCCC